MPNTTLVPADDARHPAIPQQVEIAAKIRFYGEADGVGMGVLDSGDAYLTQRGLAKICGVQNAHIGTISRDWDSQKPRIAAIKSRLERLGFHYDSAHQVLRHEGRTQYAYDMPVSQAIIGYYAWDAGPHAQGEAKANARRFAGERLQLYILDALTPLEAEKVAVRPAPDWLAEKIAQRLKPREAQTFTNNGPLRFQPVTGAETVKETAEADPFTAMVQTYLKWSYLLAVAYIEAMRAMAQGAPWNRLGLYMPLQAVLEAQAEALDVA